MLRNGSNTYSKLGGMLYRGIGNSNAEIIPTESKPEKQTKKNGRGRKRERDIVVVITRRQNSIKRVRARTGR